MSRLDDLPPDQRATLSLLLRNRKSYADVAQLLDIAPRAVHDRAHAALAVLAPRQARDLPQSAAKRSATTCSVSVPESPSASRRAAISKARPRRGRGPRR